MKFHRKISLGDSEIKEILKDYVEKHTGENISDVKIQKQTHPFFGPNHDHQFHEAVFSIAEVKE